MSSPTHDMMESAPPQVAGATARRANVRAGMTRWLSYVVLALAAGLVVTFAVELGLFERKVQKTDAPLAPVEKPNQITGGPSKISGFDKNKLPFEITAQKGVQDEKVETVVHLETVDSNFARPNGAKPGAGSQRPRMARFNTLRTGRPMTIQSTHQGEPSVVMASVRRRFCRRGRIGPMSAAWS